MPSNCRGQGLTEYLILVCLIAVSAIAVVSIVGQNVRARYATISSALRGDRTVKKELQEAESETYEIRGFDDYDQASGKPR